MHESELNLIETLIVLKTNQSLSPEEKNVIKMALDSVYTSGKIEGIRQVKIK